MQAKMIKAFDKLISKTDNITEVHIVGVANDKISKQTYVEVKWSYENDTMCYCFPTKVWNDYNTFIHKGYKHV